MKKYLFIILLFGVGSGQDEYPYFSDPDKQITFEENKVYIIEKSGKELHYSGGESYTELANTFGYILLDESPKYVVKQTPLKTHYKYFYEFKIKKANRLLNELEFLLEAGYNSKAKDVYNNYENIMEPYRIKYAEYEKQFDDYIKNNKTSKQFKKSYGGNCCMYIFGAIAFIGWVEIVPEIIGPALAASLIAYLTPSKQYYEVNSLTQPTPPTEPQLKQILSNEQIKSLAESYNRRIYNEISSGEFIPSPKINKQQYDYQKYDNVNKQSQSNNNSGAKVTYIPYDDPPVAKTSIKPIYPKIAQEAGIKGVVVVQAFIDINGIVKETLILKGIPNSGLNEAAMVAIRKTTFKPALQRGKPVGVWISIPINFSLK